MKNTQGSKVASQPKDIIDRLRYWANMFSTDQLTAGLMDDAADKIERLREALHEADKEIERLMTELGEWPPKVKAELGQALGEDET